MLHVRIQFSSCPYFNFLSFLSFKFPFFCCSSFSPANCLACWLVYVVIFVFSMFSMWLHYLISLLHVCDSLSLSRSCVTTELLLISLLDTGWGISTEHWVCWISIGRKNGLTWTTHTRVRVVPETVIVQKVCYVCDMAFIASLSELHAILVQQYIRAQSQKYYT